MWLTSTDNGPRAGLQAGRILSWGLGTLATEGPLHGCSEMGDLPKPGDDLPKALCPYPGRKELVP